MKRLMNKIADKLADAALQEMGVSTVTTICASCRGADFLKERATSGTTCRNRAYGE